MKKHLHESVEQELGRLNEWVDAVKADGYPPSAYDQARRNLLQRLPPDPAHPGHRWLWLRNPLTMGLSVAGVALLLLLNPLLGGSGEVLADIVESLHNATTIEFIADWHFEGHDQPTRVEMAFRQPGLQRIVMTYQGAKTIQINDTTLDRGLILVPSAKSCVTVDLENMPDTERERLGLISLLTEDLWSLPAQADAVLGETEMDGRVVRGYRIGERTLWIDEDRAELVRMELGLGGIRMVMYQFRLDPPDLDQAMFSTTPPPGYTSATGQNLVYDLEGAGETDLVEFLRFMAGSRIDGQFPSMVNPMEILTLQERGLLREDRAATLQQTQAAGLAFARASQRAVTFVMDMTPDNHWSYAGDGVSQGTPDTPIAWWKPAGTDAYRVIWADLTCSDELAWEPPSKNE